MLILYFVRLAVEVFNYFLFAVCITGVVFYKAISKFFNKIQIVVLIILSLSVSCSLQSSYREVYAPEKFKVEKNEKLKVLQLGNERESNPNYYVFNQTNLSEMEGDNYYEALYLPSTVNQDKSFSCYGIDEGLIINYLDKKMFATSGEILRDKIRNKVLENHISYSSLDRKKLEDGSLNNFYNYHQRLSIDIEAKTCMVEISGNKKIPVLTEKIKIKEQIGFNWR